MMSFPLVDTHPTVSLSVLPMYNSDLGCVAGYMRKKPSKKSGGYWSRVNKWPKRWFWVSIEVHGSQNYQLCCIKHNSKETNIIHRVHHLVGSRLERTGDTTFLLHIQNEPDLHLQCDFLGETNRWLATLAQLIHVADLRADSLRTASVANLPASFDSVLTRSNSQSWWDSMNLQAESESEYDAGDQGSVTSLPSISEDVHHDVVTSMKKDAAQQDCETRTAEQNYSPFSGQHPFLENDIIPSSETEDLSATKVRVEDTHSAIETAEEPCASNIPLVPYSYDKEFLDELQPFLSSSLAHNQQITDLNINDTSAARDTSVPSIDEVTKDLSATIMATIDRFQTLKNSIHTTVSTMISTAVQETLAEVAGKDQGIAESFMPLVEESVSASDMVGFNCAPNIVSDHDVDVTAFLHAMGQNPHDMPPLSMMDSVSFSTASAVPTSVVPATATIDAVVSVDHDAKKEYDFDTEEDNNANDKSTISYDANNMDVLNGNIMHSEPKPKEHVSKEAIPEATSYDVEDEHRMLMTAQGTDKYFVTKNQPLEHGNNLMNQEKLPIQTLVPPTLQKRYICKGSDVCVFEVAEGEQDVASLSNNLVFDGAIGLRNRLAQDDSMNTNKACSGNIAEDANENDSDKHGFKIPSNNNTDDINNNFNKIINTGIDNNNNDAHDNLKPVWSHKMDVTATTTNTDTNTIAPKTTTVCQTLTNPITISIPENIDDINNTEDTVWDGTNQSVNMSTADVMNMFGNQHSPTYEYFPSLDVEPDGHHIFMYYHGHEDKINKDNTANDNSTNDSHNTTNNNRNITTSKNMDDTAPELEEMSSLHTNRNSSDESTIDNNENNVIVYISEEEEEDPNDNSDSLDSSECSTDSLHGSLTFENIENKDANGINGDKVSSNQKNQNIGRATLSSIVDFPSSLAEETRDDNAAMEYHQTPDNATINTNNNYDDEYIDKNNDTMNDIIFTNNTNDVNTEDLIGSLLWLIVQMVCAWLFRGHVLARYYLTVTSETLCLCWQNVGDYTKQTHAHYQDIMGFPKQDDLEHESIDDIKNNNENNTKNANNDDNNNNNNNFETTNSNNTAISENNIKTSEEYTSVSSATL